jgi:hypothetical protein
LTSSRWHEAERAGASLSRNSLSLTPRWSDLSRSRLLCTRAKLLNAHWGKRAPPRNVSQSHIANQRGAPASDWPAAWDWKIRPSSVVAPRALVVPSTVVTPNCAACALASRTAPRARSRVTACLRGPRRRREIRLHGFPPVSAASRSGRRLRRVLRLRPFRCRRCQRRPCRHQHRSSSR